MGWYLYYILDTNILDSAKAVSDVSWNGKMKTSGCYFLNFSFSWDSLLLKSGSLSETVWFESNGKTHPSVFSFFTVAQQRRADGSIEKLKVSSCFCCVDQEFLSLAYSALLTLVLRIPLLAFPTPENAALCFHYFIFFII